MRCLLNVLQWVADEMCEIAHSFFIRIAVMTCIVLGIAGCIPPTTSAIKVVQAPEVHEASRYRSIAVMPFDGSGGKIFGSDVESVLTQARIGREAVMRVYSSDQVRHVVNSRRSNRQPSVAEIGKLLGADAIIGGEVLSSKASDQYFTKQDSECARTEKKKFLGIPVDSCVEYRQATISCRERIADFVVNVRLTESATGRNVFAEQIAKRASSKACKDERLKDEAVLLAEAKEQILNRIRQAIIPHESEQKVALLPADEKLSRSGSAEKHGEAMSFAQAGRSDRACEIFRQIFDVEKQSAALTYNIGVCEEAEGRMRDANEYFVQADGLSGSPNKAITDALQRTHKQIKDTVALRQIRPDLLPMEAKPPAEPIAVKSKPPKMSPAAIPGSGIIPNESRYALVIGNANYRKGALKNSVNDARDVAVGLKKLGFKVIKIEDGSLEKMNLAVEEFGQNIRSGGVAMFFYAGHGLQVKGENYLVPVEADLKGEEEVPFKTLNVGLVLAKLQQSSTSVNIIVLDACRDNPFARSMRSLRSGLASIDAPKGTILAYATAPGKTAADGSGRNGLYTSYLLREIAIPGVKIEDVFKHVRSSVAQDSRNEQMPWESSSLTGDFYFSMPKQ